MITSFSRTVLAVKSPYICITGLIASGGLSIATFSGTAKSFAFRNLGNSVNSKNSSLSGLPFDKVGLISNEKTSQELDYLAVSPPSELQLRADKQSYDARLKRFIAEGRVSVQLDGAVLKADRIEFDREFQTLIAHGRVRFKKASQYFQASSFRYSLIERKGILNDVYGVVDLENLSKDLRFISKRKFKTPSSFQVEEKNNLKNSKKNVDTFNKTYTTSGSVSSSLKQEIINSNSSESVSSSKIATQLERSNLKANSEDTKITKSTELACPPVLPSLPDWRPYNWAITTWGGQMTDADFGETFIIGGHVRDEYLFGVGLSKRIFRSGPFSIELGADIFRHIANKQVGGYNQADPYAETSSQAFNEAILGIAGRVWILPGFSLGIVEGVSYNSTISNFEQTNRSANSQLLNYLGFEIEALLSERVSLVSRIHHRSGAFGSFGGVEGGSNAYLLGFRYRWGAAKNAENMNTLRPPLECRKAESSFRQLPRSIDENLELLFISRKNIYPKIKGIEKFAFKNSDDSYSGLAKTNFSKLNLYQQEKLRRDAIGLIDQRIFDVKFKDDFSLQGRFGLLRPERGIEENNQSSSLSISQLNPKAGSRLVEGSVRRWRIQAGKIIITPDGWKARKISFTNDPFTPTQTRIDAYNVVAKEELNGDILITSNRASLLIEERIRIPIVKSTTIQRNETVENRWVFSYDKKDRDGFFLGRSFKPIVIGNDFRLKFQPQFLIQRSVIYETNSYIQNGSSITSDNVTADINAYDLFGLRAKLDGKALGFDTEFDANISSFNPERIANASRFSSSLKKNVDVAFLGQSEATLFGSYRYRVWNGSRGETEIYTAYGGFLEKTIPWAWGDKFNNAYTFKVGLGKYQAETLVGGKLDELWRANIYSSFTTSYNIWTGGSATLSPSYAYRYSPVPIVPKIDFDINLNQAYFVYQDDSSQKIIGFTAGPTMTLGTFSKPFFDYTKVSIYYGSSIKEGSSPFSFDDVVDLATLGVGLTQQLVGPLVLNTGFEFNIDSGSEYYGEAIDSNVELRWQRRSYDFGLFYNPSKRKGGISVHLNDFSFGGTGLPFVPYSPKEIK